MTYIRDKISYIGDSAPIRGVKRFCNSCIVQRTIGCALEALATAANVASFLGLTSEQESVPYLTFVITPIYLAATLPVCYQRSKLMIQALRCKKYSIALLFGGISIETLGRASGILAKSCIGSAQLIGIDKWLAAREGIRTLFTLVLPILFVASGAIGGIAELIAIRYQSSTVHGFHRLERLGTGLDYLLGGLTAPASDGKDPEQVVVHQNFIDRFSTAPGRFEELQGALANYFKAIEGPKKAQLGRALLIKGRGELHRRTLYHLVDITNYATIFTSGVLYLLGSKYYQVASILSIASSILHVSKNIFDVTISMERFGKIDNALYQQFFLSRCARRAPPPEGEVQGRSRRLDPYSLDGLTTVSDEIHPN